MALPSREGLGWVGFTAAEAARRLPGPPYSDPPSKSPHKRVRACWGSAVGRPARWLPRHGARACAGAVPACLAQCLQRQAPHIHEQRRLRGRRDRKAQRLARRSSRCEHNCIRRRPAPARGIRRAAPQSSHREDEGLARTRRSPAGQRSGPVRPARLQSTTSGAALPVRNGTTPAAEPVPLPLARRRRRVAAKSPNPRCWQGRSPWTTPTSFEVPPCEGNRPVAIPRDTRE